MKNNKTHATADIPEGLLEDAAIWQARLREVDQDSRAGQKLRADFSAWLLADPLHRKAFAEMEVVFGALEEPVARAVAEQGRRPGYSGAAGEPESVRPTAGSGTWPLSRFATAACLALALLMGFGWQQDWTTRWQSDYLTATGEQMPVVLDDGSRITLNTQSAVSVEYNGSERRVRLITGEVWFEVDTDHTRPFTVDTGQGLVTVTGTRFNVRLDHSVAVVSLDDGNVQLRGGDAGQKETVMLSSGQQAQISASGITRPEGFDRTAVKAWQRGQFVFYNRPLAEVVATLNRYRSGRILITDEELNSLKVSGVFSTEDPDAALEVITNTLPVEQTRMTDYLVLLR